MKLRISFTLSLCLALLAFLGLILFPEMAANGASMGLALCGTVIIPSLFPFAVLASLLLELKIPNALGKFMSPLMTWLFGVSGRGSAAFFLGLVGGYPLGAMTVSEMYSVGELNRDEAERLLGFCNNCGPAFILAVAGTAIFSSSAVGFFLYGVHVFSAVLVGVCLRKKSSYTSAVPTAKATPPNLAEALTVSVKRAGTAAITVSGFVVFFSVLVALLDASGILPALCGILSAEMGLELHFTRSLMTGFLELGTGTGSMLGLSLNRANLALCAFILGWGGLSVQAQATALIKESGLSPAKHFLGKMLHGVLSALVVLFVYPLFF